MTTTHDDEFSDWNEAMLAGALRAHHGERAPDLTASILSRTGHGRVHEPIAMSPPRRKTWLAAALVVLGASAVFAVAFTTREVAPAQEPDKRFWPLDPGATWVFHVDRQGVVSELTQRAMTTFPFQAANEAESRDVCQMFVRDGAESGFDYVAADARGVYRYMGTRRFAGPGLSAEAPVCRLLSLPVGVETQWQTSEQRWQSAAAGVRLPPAGAGAGAGAGGGGGGGGFGGAAGGVARAGVAAGGRAKAVVDLKRVDLVAPQVKVKVPAGEFTAVHVRLQPAEAQLDPAQAPQPVEQLWLVAGKGIVRRVVEQDGKVVETAELKSFTPGTADPDARDVLAKFLKRDASITSLGPVQGTEWVEPVPNVLRLRSRFCVVSFVDKKVAFCVHGKDVTTFDPADTALWTALVRDEGLTGWNDGLLPQSRCTALADVAVRLQALLRGWKISGRANDSSVSIGPEGARMRLGLLCVDAEGKAQRVNGELAVGSNDQVTKVEFPE